MKHTVWKTLGEILPVLGTIGLLGLWLYQQVGVERRSAELRSLDSARGVFQTYQSNNALFNAIQQQMIHQPEQSENVRRFQVYNYELGLTAIEAVLTDAERSGIPTRVGSPWDGDWKSESRMAVTQQRLELLQTRLDAKEKRVHDCADAAKRLYTQLYILMSLVSVSGAICKVVASRPGAG